LGVSRRENLTCMPAVSGDVRGFFSASGWFGAVVGNRSNTDCAD
jgi:hypothetical protein